MTHGRIIGVLATLTFIATPAFAKAFPAVPGEYVVKFKSSAAVSGRVINAKENLFLVRRPVIELQQSALQTLNGTPAVEYAEPNYIYRVRGGANVLPNDVDLGALWGLMNNGQMTTGDMGSIQGKAGMDIDAARAWQIETGSKDVLVAVIDTGVNWSHPDLIDNIFTNEAELNGTTGVDDDQNGCVDDVHGCDFAQKDGDPMDVYGHGTHVSGTIGATGNNATGITGVAWNVKILPVRFLSDDGSGTLEDAIKSIDYATSMKVRIMSNSWGGGGFSQALLDSIVKAKDAGILFIAAAGNSSNDNDAVPEYPCNYQVDNVISVAAIDPTGALANFSSFGKNTVHIAAPGGNISSYTMKGLESWSGTSMATPHVSGVAALLFSQDKDQSYITVKNRLLASARPTAALRGRVASGLVNAYFALTNTVAPSDPGEPYNWAKTTDVVTTPHPYTDKFKQDYVLTVPGAKKVSVYFSKFETEATYDKVVFKDASGHVFGELSGKIGETFSPVVDGDTVIMTFTSDDSVSAYGFDVSGIAYQ